MIKIHDLSLLDIAAKSTLTDKNTEWIYKAIDFAIQRKNEKLKSIFAVLDRIHYLGEKKIELLLWEYHVEGFNESTTIEEKRILILQSLLTHMQKGTVGIVKKNCDLLFGNSEIEEWYKYGGTPGRFKIKTKSNTQKDEIYKKIINVIENTKNVRSHLDEITFIRENIIDFFIGIGSVTNNYYIVEIGG